MVAYCIAYGCKNLHNKTDCIHFHRFPFNRPEIIKRWLNAIRRDKWKPSASSRLCSVHFNELDYIITPGSSRKVLKLDAVPSNFNFPKHLVKETSSRHCTRRVLCRTVEEEETENTEVSIETDERHIERTNDAQTQTYEYYQRSVRDYSQQRTIKSLKQKIRRKDVKLNNMQTVIHKLKNSICTSENLTLVLENYFKGFPLELLTHQHKNETAAPVRRRYTEKMKEFAHTLYFYSPKAYKFIRQYFTLPNGRTIRKWLSSVDYNPGFISEWRKKRMRRLKRKRRKMRARSK